MLLVIGGLSTMGRAMRDSQGKTGRKGQQWPGPVAGRPSRPRQVQRPAQPRPQAPGPTHTQSPWPTQTSQQGGRPWPQAASPYQPPTWPTGAPAPQTGPAGERSQSEALSGEGISIEGRLSDSRSTEGVGTEGVRSEGPSAGSFADDRARFQSERAAFRQPRQEGGLHQFGTVVEPEPQLEERAPSPVVAMLGSREGLAQAIVAAEVLGKPRALRPYVRR